ncbi:MAG: enoyl-CoA hydratase/isomerase family protein [Patulibacter sp.]|nr:enoyl-CoA hydratase/isomerase family protein [Patulibacter sp.]
MSDAGVAIERRGAASWATIARPRRGNALDGPAIERLIAWARDTGGDPDVRALVLTGRGPAFCAGADMAAGAPLLDDPDALLAYVDRGRDLVRALREAPVPVVAAVNGVAFAGGFELVLAADVVVAARSARLGDRHVRHGVVPGWGATVLLPERVGRRAARLLLSGVDLAADELRTLGVVDLVVDDGDLAARTDELVVELGAADAAAQRRVLPLARGPWNAAAHERERAALGAHLATDEFRAAVRRFVGGD